jgi:hypothetical protein
MLSRVMVPKVALGLALLLAVCDKAVSQMIRLMAPQPTHPWAWSRSVDFPLVCPQGVRAEDVLLKVFAENGSAFVWQQDPVVGVEYDRDAGVHRALSLPKTSSGRDCPRSTSISLYTAGAGSGSARNGGKASVLFTRGR